MSEQCWTDAPTLTVGDTVFLADGDDTLGEVIAVLPDAEPDTESVQVRWLCDGGQDVWYPADDLERALTDAQIEISGIGMLPFYSPELGEEWNDL